LEQNTGGTWLLCDGMLAQPAESMWQQCITILNCHKWMIGWDAGDDNQFGG
jgi:hypothetical protein